MNVCPRNTERIRYLTVLTKQCPMILCNRLYIRGTGFSTETSAIGTVMNRVFIGGREATYIPFESSATQVGILPDGLGCLLLSATIWNACGSAASHIWWKLRLPYCLSEELMMRRIVSQVVALTPPYDCGSGSEPSLCDNDTADYSSGQQILVRPSPVALNQTA